MRRTIFTAMLSGIALFCLSTAASAQSTAVNIQSLLQNVPYGPLPVNIQVTSPSGIPAGTVGYIVDGGTPQNGVFLDNNGNCTITLPSMNVGTHSVEFDYSSSNGYDSSSATASVSVVQDSLSISIGTDASNVSYGSGPNVTATVTGGPHYGVLSYWADGTQLINLSPYTQFNALFPSTTIPAGTHNLYVRFDSLDGNTMAAQSNMVPVNVAKGTPRVFLNGQPNPAQLGTNVVFNALIEPAADITGVPPTGTVDFSEGTTDFGTVPIIVNGFGTSFCSENVSTLAVGTHTITATYSGDSNYLSGSITWTETINPVTISTNTGLWTDSLSYVYNQPVQAMTTVTAVDGSTPTGSVVFDEGQNPLGSVTLSGGQGTLTITPGFSAGNHTLTAIFQPTGIYVQSASNGTTITVSKATPSLQLSGPSQANSGQAFTYTVTISGPYGGAATGSVDVQDGTTDLGSFPLSGNVASCSLTLSSGVNHTLSFNYSGDSNFNAGSSSASVKVLFNSPPVISNVPAAITVDGKMATGAVVTYATPTATDLNDGTDPVICTPASGSTFPFGTTTVTCKATNSLGLSSTATFTVTVRGAREMEESITSTLQGIKMAVSSDQNTLNSAIAQLVKADTSTNWTSDVRLVVKTGGNVFSDWGSAVSSLNNLIGNSKEAASKSALQAAASRIVATARLVTVVAMSTTTNATNLATANSNLSKGDTAAAANQYSTAIGDYKTAWSKATQ